MSYHIDRQLNLFDWLWQEAIDTEHELIKLAHKIDWDNIACKLRKFYSRRGRHDKDVRLMSLCKKSKKVLFVYNMQYIPLKSPFIKGEFCRLPPLLRGNF